jgi:hypothetical protein
MTTFHEVIRFIKVHWNSGWILHTRPDKCKHRIATAALLPSPQLFDPLSLTGGDPSPILPPSSGGL